MASDHIEPRRLLDLAWADATETDDETKHLRECEECKDALEVFARRFNKHHPGLND
jgi:hypothetical protein